MLSTFYLKGVSVLCLVRRLNPGTTERYPEPLFYFLEGSHEIAQGSFELVLLFLQPPE